MESHISVLMDEVVHALAITKSSIIIDATLGSSGHAKCITDAMGPKGKFLGIDADKKSIQNAKKILQDAVCQVILCVENFRNIEALATHHKFLNVDGIVADLGWRMDQFSGSGKGFSFLVDEPLLMTFGDPASYHFVAHDIINSWKEIDIENVIRGYGEERYAKRIAQKIVSVRSEHQIQTTFDLVRVIESAVPGQYRHGRIHSATRTFQALRIAVNDELENLEIFIKDAVSLLKPQGHLVIISFHSIEDRIVKHLFKQFVKEGKGEVITKKPIIASTTELENNPRARSAKMRIFKKNENTQTNNRCT